MIEFIDLSYGYKSNLPILKNVSFKIPKGKIVGLIGPNGAGKSTIFKLLCGIIVPAKGCAFYNQIDIAVSNNNFKEESASIIESPFIYQNLTVWENFIYFKLLLNRSVSECNELLEEFLLLKHKNTKASKLSSGLKQRLGLALILLKRPAILFLDEPINAIDPFGIKFFREKLLVLNKEFGITIVVSGHMLSELEKLCQQFIILDKGRVVCNFENNFKHGNMSYFSTKNDNEIKEILLDNGVDHVESEGKINFVTTSAPHGLANLESQPVNSLEDLYFKVINYDTV